jgi:predicted nuclease of predicted toxin-antitoxin system
MRVLLDENLDRRLKRAFDSDYEVMTVTERGWSGKKNGDLLRVAEVEFDVLVTLDKSIEYQQNLSRIKLGIVIISAPSNCRQDVEPAMPEVNKILRTIRSGEVIHVAT